MPHFLLEGEGHKLRGLDGRLGRACDVNDASVYEDAYFGGGVGRGRKLERYVVLLGGSFHTRLT